MVDVITPLFLALIVSFAEYFGKSLDLQKKAYYRKIVSFTAGISVTYILLELFPAFAAGAFEIHKLLFLSLLIGFISHHVIEKEIYKHNRAHELVRMLSIEENTFYYVYHVVLGIVLVALMNRNPSEGIFFFVSILAYTVASNLPSSPHPSRRRMAFLSTSTFLGALLSVFLVAYIPPMVEIVLIGFVAGVLLFTVTRHHIPYGKYGDIGFFSLGCILYTFFIGARWFL